MWRYFGGITVLAVVAVVTAYFLSDNESGAEDIGNPPPSPVGSPFGEQQVPTQKPAQASSKPFKHRGNRNANARPTDDGSRVIQTTKRHLWLLAVAVGDVITNEMIATELGIEPALGWHEHRSIILAVLVEPGSFQFHKSGRRLRVSSNDYGAAALPPILNQAVPILSACADGWKFMGFFRLGHPAKTSVACTLIDGAPPELLDLKRRNDDGGA